jgi:hypothetical protein
MPQADQSLFRQPPVRCGYRQRLHLEFFRRLANAGQPRARKKLTGQQSHPVGLSNALHGRFST